MTALALNHTKANLHVAVLPTPAESASLVSLIAKKALDRPLGLIDTATTGSFSDENAPPSHLFAKKILVSPPVVPLRSLGLPAKALNLPIVSMIPRFYETTVVSFKPKQLSNAPLYAKDLQAKVEYYEAIGAKVSITLNNSLMSIAGMKQFAAPTNRGLMLLSAYYFNRYNVDIVVTGSSAAFAYALSKPSGFCMKETPKAWGIIAVQRGFSSHATPVICYQKDETSPIHYLILDSIQDPTKYVWDHFKSLKEEEVSVSSYVVKGKRQLDLRGCRTDALCILKDALRQLNSLDIENMDEFLKITDLETSYLTGSKIFNMPATWAKTAQTPESLKQVNLSDTTLAGETLESFRARYTLFDALRIEKYRLDAKLITGETVSHDYQCRLLKPQCAYLNYKGKRNFYKVMQILKDKDPLIKMRFALLNAFFEEYASNKI